MNVMISKAPDLQTYRLTSYGQFFIYWVSEAAATAAQSPHGYADHVSQSLFG